MSYGWVSEDGDRLDVMEADADFPAEISVIAGRRGAMSLPVDPCDVQALVNAILHVTGCRLIGNEVVNTEAYRAHLLDELARESVMSDDEYNAAKS